MFHLSPIKLVSSIVVKAIKLWGRLSTQFVLDTSSKLSHLAPFEKFLVECYNHSNLYRNINPGLAKSLIHEFFRTFAGIKKKIVVIRNYLFESCVTKARCLIPFSWFIYDI